MLNMINIEWEDNMFTIKMDSIPIATGNAANAELVCIYAAKEIAKTETKKTFSSIVLGVYSKVLMSRKTCYERIMR